MTRRREEGGFTLVELMISVVLAAIATGFAFSIYARASQSSRAQSRVAETQQTLRAASQVLSRELRNAGMYATTIGQSASGTPDFWRALDVVNNRDNAGPDSFRVVYADSTLRTRVSMTGPDFNSAETSVDTVTGWSVGDIAVAVRTSNPGAGQACILEITAIQDQVNNQKLQHRPTGVWNQASNRQCEGPPGDPTWQLDDPGVWNDGNTLFTRMIMRSYRIAPNDPRGILQMSPSAELIANDWINLATGIIDLQMALRVYNKDDTVDIDGDGNAEYDWYSSENMETILDDGENVPVQARISILAKTLAPVNAVVVEQTPDLFNSDMPIANNDVGDRPGTVLPVSNTASPYYGDNIYRWSSTIVDLRNLGKGIQQDPLP